MKPSASNVQWFIILCCIFSSHLFSQWSTNPALNTGICVAPGSQSSPKIIDDGVGGFILVWDDARNGNYDIYAQKINASGKAQWTPNGIAVCKALGDQGSAEVISDGKGGAIVVWGDYRSGSNNDIYIQRIDANGAALWTSDGVALCTAADNQMRPKIVSDDSGGAIITWEDQRTVTATDIYAQKINSSGVVQWTADGVAICTASNSQYYPKIVDDGTGGAIITWMDARNGNYDIYAQRISASDSIMWTIDGVAICTALDNQYYPVIVDDGVGGVIIAWDDVRSGGSNYDVYAQRITTAGIVKWTADGVPISTAISSQGNSRITSDGFGGAIITWEDYRSGAGSDIYAQKINIAGVVQWTIDGVAICTASGKQQNPEIVGDGADGAFITWIDLRNATDFGIYAQRINAAGTAMWSVDGVPISSAANTQSTIKIVNDGTGGAIIAWQDYRNGSDYDIYAQKIDQYGYLGNANANLVAVKDIANDQGGKLRIFWDPSSLDADTFHVVKSYTILRGAKPTGVLGKTSNSASNGIYWEEAKIVNASHLSGYSTVVTTYADSGLQGVPKYYFQIIARNGDSTQTWYTNIDSGYSVDNIAPVGITGANISGGQNSLVHLQWNKDIVDPDIMGYYVYRSTTTGFLPDGTTLLALTSENFYSDTSKLNNQKYYYRVAAVDIHGNAGPVSAELQVTVTGVADNDIVPKQFALLQNYPNPFNPSTEIQYQLPVKDFVSLNVYDALGKEVATLVNEVKEAGYYSATFDASKLSTGIYFAKLQSGEKVQLKKMILLK